MLLNKLEVVHYWIEYVGRRRVRRKNINVCLEGIVSTRHIHIGPDTVVSRVDITFECTKESVELHITLVVYGIGIANEGLNKWEGVHYRIETGCCRVWHKAINSSGGYISRAIFT